MIFSRITGHHYICNVKDYRANDIVLMIIGLIIGLMILGLRIIGLMVSIIGGNVRIICIISKIIGGLFVNYRYPVQVYTIP